MRQHRIALLIASFSVGLLRAHSALAYGGTDPVVVDDGMPRRCIDTRYDRVSVMLARLVVAKPAPKSWWDPRGWLGDAPKIDAIIETEISFRRSGSPDTPVSIPMAFPVNIKPYRAGVIALPVRFRLVTDLPLQDSTAWAAFPVTPSYLYPGTVPSEPGWKSAFAPERSHVVAIDFKFSFFDMSGSTLAARIIKRLAESSKEAPIGPESYGAVSYAGSLISGIVDDVVASSGNDDPASHEGAISFQFDKNGDCGRIGATSGPYALISEPTEQSDHEQLLLNKLHDYCFYADPDTKALTYAAKPLGSILCPPLSGAGVTKEVVNRHYLFLLDAQRANAGGLAGPQPQPTFAPGSPEKTPLGANDQRTETLVLKRLAYAHEEPGDNLRRTEEDPTAVTMAYEPSLQNYPSIAFTPKTFTFAFTPKTFTYSQAFDSSPLRSGSYHPETHESIVKIQKDSPEYKAELLAAERCVSFQIPLDQCD